MYSMGGGGVLLFLTCWYLRLNSKFLFLRKNLQFPFLLAQHRFHYNETIFYAL